MAWNWKSFSQERPNPNYVIGLCNQNKTRVTCHGCGGEQYTHFSDDLVMIAKCTQCGEQAHITIYHSWSIVPEIKI